MAAEAAGRRALAVDIVSFRLHLAAENKAEKTVWIYTGAVRRFAAAHLLRETDKTRWENRSVCHRGCTASRLPGRQDSAGPSVVASWRRELTPSFL
jgi:hypothetical protein